MQPLPERRLTVKRLDAAHVQVTLSGVTARLRSGDRFSELPGALLSADAPIGEAAARAARLLRSRTVRARLEQLPDGGTDLDGKGTNAEGYFLLGNKGVVPTPDLTFSDGRLQNGPDAVALYEANAADFPAGSPITAEISIPNSGGYEIWRSTTVRNVYLPAGTQTIEVRIVTGGFDLASIDLR